jgi:hypothetical protein
MRSDEDTPEGRVSSAVYSAETKTSFVRAVGLGVGLVVGLAEGLAVGL